jgi:DNA repair protein RadD
VRETGKPCPECGFQPSRPGRFVDVLDGELAHLTRNGKLQPHEYSPEQRQEFQAMLTYIAEERGYKPGWIAHKYKEKFGQWPRHRYVSPILPSAEVLAWDRHCRIRYAKRMAADT